MTPANDNAPTARPAEFDAMLVAYKPGLESLAYRLGFRGEAREELVLDTIVHCLEHWRAHRPEQGFWKFLQWRMRGVASNKRQRRTVQLVHDVDGKAAASLTAQAMQEIHVDLSRALAAMPARGRDIVVRRAIGED